METKRGHYLGTELGGAWYKRYRKDGMLAHGVGEHWIDDGQLHFRRYLTKNPIRIPLRRVSSVELGRWHAGRWVGSVRAVKLVWERDGAQLSSGFVFTRTSSQAAAFCRKLRELTGGLSASRHFS